jgi:hypothetical protein
MAENKFKLQLPNGNIGEGVDVPIKESSESSAIVKLEDGTILRVKFSIIQVIRADGEYDPDGNTFYAVKGAPMVAITSIKDELRKK